jgi:hypothetical protein
MVLSPELHDAPKLWRLRPFQADLPLPGKVFSKRSHFTIDGLAFALLEKEGRFLELPFQTAL